MDIPSVTVDQMREVDRLMTEELGISLLQMMENAGRALAEVVVERYGPALVTILVGKGNNGGGGLVAARYLHNKGVEVEVVLSSDDIGETPRHQLTVLERLEIPVSGSIAHRDGVVIDALLGYNQRGSPRGRVGDLIIEANDLGLPVVSLDVPSGFDMVTGEFHEVSFKGSTVVTLGLPKAMMVGRIDDLWLADIGIPPAVYERIGIDVPVLFQGTGTISIARPSPR